MKGDNKNGGKSVIGAALIGAALGAAGVALAHKPTRNKVKKSIENALNQGEEKLEEAASKVSQIRDNTREKAAKELKKVQQKLEKGN